MINIRDHGGYFNSGQSGKKIEFKPSTQIPQIDYNTSYQRWGIAGDYAYSRNLGAFSVADLKNSTRYAHFPSPSNDAGKILTSGFDDFL